MLLLLEKESAESNALYGNFVDFIELLKSGNSFVRTRGFRLACAQAQWDVDNQLEENLDVLLGMLDDEKPTAVRQRLSALHEVVRCKPQLARRVEDKRSRMDLSQYKDSMRPLMEADIAALRKLYE